MFCLPHSFNKYLAVQHHEHGFSWLIQHFFGQSALYITNSVIVYYLLFHLKVPACDPGQYGNGTSCTDCPLDTFSPAWNPSVAVVGDCLTCPPGSTTWGNVGETNCSECQAGYYGSPPHSCSACPVDTFSDDWTPEVAVAGDCQSCGNYSSTQASIGATSCTRMYSHYILDRLVRMGKVLKWYFDEI